MRIDEGRFLVSDDADVLRSLSTTPGEPPLEIQKLLEGDAMIAIDAAGCVESTGVVTNVDGSGRLVFMLSDEPDPARFRPRSAAELEAPQVEGDALIVEIQRESPVSPRDIQSELLPGYDCE